MGSLSAALPAREPSVSDVRNELQVILASPSFRQSHGLAKLLRYICSKALVQDSEAITEYTIAVDVLGKPRDFKESKDAGVRVEVHRLRKRLAEYYEREGAHHSVRILIPTGRYAPEFLACDHPGVYVSSERGPENGSAASSPPVAVDSVAPVAVHPIIRRLRRVTAKGLWLAGGLVAAVTLALGTGLLRWADPLDSFWRPVFSSPNPILLCFGNVAGAHRSRTNPSTAEALTLLEYHGLPSEMMLVADAVTVSKFTGLLQSKHKRYRVASQSEANFADLQSGPAVLIGLANNDWTERLVGKLRFTLEHRPPGRLVLRDSDNPGGEDWSVDYKLPYLSMTRDYALVVRVLDPRTEQMVVTAAGLSVFGTLAAGEFLTNPEEFRKLQAVAPRGWQQKNFEVVLSTDVIRGKSGHPNVVAAHFW